MLHSAFWETETLRKQAIHTIQVNLGNRCNQSCVHCHIEASPSGDRNMDRNTAEKLLGGLIETGIKDIEFTGGAPEMNEQLPYFIGRLTEAGRRVTVRTNLTVLAIPDYSWLIDLYKSCGVRLIASMPSVFEDITDLQRGKGVFRKSIDVLKRLNQAGYGSNILPLYLAYNPSSDFLPPDESQTETEFRHILNDRYGIRFTGLMTIANVPIARYRRWLQSEDRYEKYMTLLRKNFNSATLDRLMCRSQISVDYMGYIYDCDFNLSLGIRIKGHERVRFWEIDFSDFRPEISCAEHCLACTVNMGSSCSGALIKNPPDRPSETTSSFDATEVVRRYYGQELTRTEDLKTGACCTVERMPEHVLKVMPLIHEEIKQKYYGCGNIIPLCIEGLTIIDLGCGTGRDAFVMSKLVGEKGFVYGIDMTEEQIGIAKKYESIQAARFGYAKKNTYFIHDQIENVGKHILPETIDIVVSNCVINLVEDKERVLRIIYGLLKEGGEFYFSDIYADRRLPDGIREDPVLYGECLGGALYWRDFERIARRTGFIDPRVVSSRRIDIKDEKIKALTGAITFYSTTYRLWKINGLEDACEDYGHFAVYRGGIEGARDRFLLDRGHVFEKNRPERVCGNTALMLMSTRLSRFFDVTGSFEEHFGTFAGCGTGSQGISNSWEEGACC